MTTTSNETATTVWAIDPTHTLVEFSAKHMMITTVKGRFGEVQGEIRFDEAEPANSSAEVTIATASIDTRVEQRDGHLRSGDFLDVETYPSITFRSKAIRGSIGVPGASFELVGDLTIRGVTREVTVEASYDGRGRDPWGGERVSFSGTTKIDRRDFGLTWNQALETGGILVGNDIKIALEVQAVRA
ncbi:MAG TPA: YceI family protein [Longimicrobiaceae bacterium]|nr:YceI family protein [Longimicrobiaceae bacterium]